MDGYHAMEMEFEEFETNVDPDLTQNDSMNQTQTSTNFTKEEKSILKQFYAEIPNPTDEEIETLALQIEHQLENGENVLKRTEIRQTLAVVPFNKEAHVFRDSFVTIRLLFHASP